MLGLLVLIFALLQLQSAAQPDYEILFERFGSDTISLQCRHAGQFVQINETIRYWVNITNGVRPPGFEPDLQRRLDSALIIPEDRSVAPRVTFKISPELEGLYTCGLMDTGNNVIAESEFIYLTSQQRDGLPIQLDLAARSSRNITFPCSYDVGRLSGCYYGQWLKDSMTIVEILSPGLGCRDIKGTPASQKYLIDRSTFSLTVTNIVPADSGNYTCELVLVDPQSPAGQTVPFTPLVSHSLSVDVPPVIVEGPEDEIVGMNDTTRRLSTSVTLTCTAVGLPSPEIIWTYNASLTGEIQTYTDEDSNVCTIAMGKDQSGPYNGRFRVKSTLVLPILPTDGGTVTCKTGDGTGPNQSDDARLTVLAAPSSIRLIKSCGGEIVYEVNLPVRLNRPAVMKFSYINSNNEILPRRGMPAEVEVGDTNIIFFREDRDALPFTNYRVIITLSIATKSQLRDSPSFISEQTINANELSEGAKIGISAGLGVFIVSVLLLVLCIIVTCCLVKRSKVKDHLISMKKIVRDFRSLHSISIESNNTDSVVQNATDSKQNTASNGQNTDPKEKLLQDRLQDLTNEIDDLAKILKVDVDAESDTPDPVIEENIQNFKRSMEKALAIIKLKNEAKQGRINVKVDIEEAQM